MRTPNSPFAPLSPQTYHVLAALTARPLHAYAIREQIIVDSALSVTPTTGSLHHTLKQLRTHNFIATANIPTATGRPRYTITPAGRRAFELELARLQRAVTVGQLAHNHQFATR